MFTMLTSIAYIDIGEYKNPSQYLENNPNYPVLATFWTIVWHFFGIVRHLFWDGQAPFLG